MGRVIEASAHLTMCAGVAAKPTKIIGAEVKMDVTVDSTSTAMPKELEGITIELTGPRAMEMMGRIAQAVEAIKDPNTSPEERQVLIDAIKAFKKPEAGEGA